MRHRALVAAAATGSILLTALPGGAASPDLLRKRPFVVVAVVDSGINPYHVDFRRPDLTAHPSTYIEGFPKNVRALDLTLDAPSYDQAVARDAAKWSSVGGDVVWIPGTNIVAAIDVGNGERAFLDQTGHGTAVASIAGGKIHGPGSSNVLIVAVSSFTAGLRWATRQPWIDVITNSWTTFDPEPLVDGAAAATRDASARGTTVCFASGNLSIPLLVTGEQGPSWHVNVGAASQPDRREFAYTGWPNDVLGIANVPAADHRSLREVIEFNGTSAATPHVCGLIARTLADVRARLGDARQGPVDGVVARGPKQHGYLEDGILTDDELVDAVQATAVPADSKPPDTESIGRVPALPVAPWIRGGYGIVDRDTIKDALAVVFGRKDRPDREMEDAWVDAMDAVRDAVWGKPPP